MLALLLVGAAANCRAAQELVTVPTRSGVTETYLLIRNPPSATPKVVVLAFVGGFGACDPQSPHGFFGKDAPVAQAMKNWMLGRDFAREIK